MYLRKGYEFWHHQGLHEDFKIISEYFNTKMAEDSLCHDNASHALSLF